MAEFSTTPGDRSVGELEREVDRERERVSATIDELQARASVGSLVDQLVKAVGENGGEVSRNLGRSLRDNPLAALLTGVGLAWLMAGSGRPRDEGARLGRPGQRLPALRARPASGGFGTRCVDVRKHQLAAPGRTQPMQIATPRPEEGGLRERVAEIAGRVGDGISDAVEGIARARLRNRHIPQAPGSARPATPSVRPVALSAIVPAPRVERLPGRANTCAMVSTRLIEDQPLVAGAIAMAVGSRCRRGSPALTGRGSHVR